MRTVAELRPPRLYSVLSTTIGSLPCMMTLPARISWASFMVFSWRGRSVADRVESLGGTVSCGRATVVRALGAKPLILAFRRGEGQQAGREIRLCAERLAPRED